MDIKAWAVAVSHCVSAPTGLQIQTSRYAQCSHKTLLPIPYHANRYVPRSPQEPSPAAHTDLFKSVPGIFLMARNAMIMHAAQ